MTKMDTMYFAGVVSGIAIAYCYDLIARHQRRKQRQRRQQAARAWKM